MCLEVFQILNVIQRGLVADTKYCTVLGVRKYTSSCEEIIKQFSWDTIKCLLGKVEYVWKT